MTLPLGLFVGLDDVKMALMCMAVDPRIRGLLVRGVSGTGKSEVVRSFAETALGRRPVNLPLNATEEQVFGTLDIGRAIASSEAVLEPGILGRADGGVLVVDDINLMDRRLVHEMMGSVTSGRVSVERDGVSASYRCDVSVVATMNSREAPIDRNLSDLFEMCVTVRGRMDEDSRAEVILNNISFAGDPGDDSVTISRIDSARSIIGDVTVPEDVMRSVVDACVGFGVRGYRGELSSLRVSRALAALDGRTEVTHEDAGRAMMLCLAHRRERSHPSEDDGGERVLFFSDSHIKRCIHDERRQTQPAPAEDAPSSEQTQAVSEEVGSGALDDSDEVVIGIGDYFESIDLEEESIARGMLMDAHMLRRTVRDVGREGRYVSSRPLEEGSSDIAVDATVRAAAPYQSVRRGDDATGRVVVLPEDLRMKVREKHVSCLFLFVIDNSGSLVIRSRMRAVKAAVLSMLNDHYERRDSVGIVTFNEKYVGMVQPPTRSVGSLRRVLDDIAAGRRTPLSEALAFTGSFASNYVRKHPSERCFIVLMTDGVANIPMTLGAEPFPEALRIAGRVPRDRIDWVVVDTSSREDPERHAQRLAEAMNAPYYRLDELRSSKTGGARGSPPPCRLHGLENFSEVI